MQITKECCTCKQIKDVSFFGVYTRNKDGLNNNCKECVALKCKTRRHIIGESKRYRGESYILPSRSEEHCKKISNNMKLRWGNQQFKEKQIASIKKSHNTLEYKQHMSEMTTGKVLSETTKEKIGLKSKERWKDPKFKSLVFTKVQNHYSNPENRKKASERAKKALSNSSIRERIRLSLKAHYKNRTPDIKKKNNEAHRIQKPDLECHHVAYLEIHGYDEYYFVSPRDHRSKHARYRRENLCGVDAKELRRISTMANRRRLGRVTLVEELPAIVMVEEMKK